VKSHADTAAFASSVLAQWWPLKGFWMDQTGDSQKYPVHDCTEDTAAPQSLVSEVISRVGGNVRKGIIRQRYDTFRQQSSAFCSKVWFQLLLKHFTITDAVYSCTPHLVDFQNGPNASQIVSTSFFLPVVEFWTSFSLAMSNIFYSMLVCLLAGAWWWIHVMLTVTASRKSVTFFVIAVQQALTVCKTIALVLSCKLFWKPSGSVFKNP
jgi:hypothetical protein